MAAKKAASPRSPTPAALLKKVGAVSDSAKILTRELKSMGKIFGENQKVLVSMQGTMDSLASSMVQIQRQSRQVDILEEDTKKLLAGMGHSRQHAALIAKIEGQAARMEAQMRKMQEGDSGKIAKRIADSMDSIKNNSQMIIKMARRIDEVRDDLRDVSARTSAVSDVGAEIDALRIKIEKIGGDDSIKDLRSEIKGMAEKMRELEGAAGQIGQIKDQLVRISEGAQEMGAMGGLIEGLRRQIEAVSERTQKMDGMSARLADIESELGKLASKEEAAALKHDVLAQTSLMKDKIASLAETARRTESAASEFHKKTDGLFSELHQIKTGARRASSEYTGDVMALLKLSEYQSAMRMGADSKYGQAADLAKMASQTARIVNLFDELSISTGQKMPLPEEVRRWAVSKILECADRWEVRFSDVFKILIDGLGRSMLKESMRIEQVRDIYGIRAVDEIRAELGL